MKIGFLGPKGSYTNQAARQLFSQDEHGKEAFVPLQDIPRLFSSLFQGSVNISVVPIENSTNGTVEQTLSQLAEYTKLAAKDENAQFQILAETHVKVRHCLAVRPSKDSDDSNRAIAGEQKQTAAFANIKSLHTHPQAWTQCSSFLDKHFKDTTKVRRQDEDSTSTSARIVSEDDTFSKAAICSTLAAEKFGLRVLVEGIQDSKDNRTTFFAIAKNAQSSEIRIRASDVPGTDELGLVIATSATHDYSNGLINTDSDVLRNARVIPRKEAVYVFLKHLNDGCDRWLQDLKQSWNAETTWDWGRWQPCSVDLEDVSR